MESGVVTQKIRGLYKIIRVPDDIVMGVGLVVGIALAGSIEQDLPLFAYFVVFLGGFFVTAHAMVVNDIIDIDIDKINEPERVLPSGMISQETAWIYSIILAIIGLSMFGILDLLALVQYRVSWFFVLLHVILADLYNLKIKKMGFIGNIVVAYTLYALFLFADIFFNGRLTLLPQMVGLMGFSASLAREVYKGIIDMEGDEHHDVSTIAVRFGADTAKYLATTLVLVSAVFGIFILFNVNLIGVMGVIIVEGVLIYVLYLSQWAEEGTVSRKIKTWILIGPLLLAPFLVLDIVFPI